MRNSIFWNLGILVFVLSLLSAEYFVYINHLFISFNLCIFFYLWLSFIYKIYGLKEFEDKYKKDYPIEFKFSIVYLCKIIIRSFKIKWLLLKKFIIKIWTKQLGLKTFLVFISILTISFFIYKYYRSTLLLEIIEQFDLKSILPILIYLLTIISLFFLNSFNLLIKELVDTLQKLFLPVNSFMYLCLTKEKDDVLTSGINFMIGCQNFIKRFYSNRKFGYATPNGTYMSRENLEKKITFFNKKI